MFSAVNAIMRIAAKEAVVMAWVIKPQWGDIVVGGDNKGILLEGDLLKLMSSGHYP